MIHFRLGRTSGALVSKTRVLLVEDDVLIRTLVVEALEDAGYQVIEAASGDEASKKLNEANGFHLLLTDLQMPGSLDGIAVARRARELHADIPVIYMTGRPDMLRRLGPLDSRQTVLLKPCALSQILGAITR